MTSEEEKELRGQLIIAQAQARQNGAMMLELRDTSIKQVKLLKEIVDADWNGESQRLIDAIANAQSYLNNIGVS